MRFLSKISSIYANESESTCRALGILSLPFQEESNYKFTNIPLTVAFRMFFFYFYLLQVAENFLIHIFIRPWDRLSQLYVRGCLERSTSKAREYIFRTDFKGKPSSSCAVAKYDEYFMFSCSYLSFESKLSCIVVACGTSWEQTEAVKRKKIKKNMFSKFKSLHFPHFIFYFLKQWKIVKKFLMCFQQQLVNWSG